MIGVLLESLFSTLQRHAETRGAQTALQYLHRGEEISDAVTYAELHRAAAIVAANLLSARLNSSPVMLALPQGIDFVRCFLGCVYAGAIAIPTPGLTDPRAVDRILSIAGAARPAAVIAPSAALESGIWQKIRARAPHAAFISAEDLLRGGSPIEHSRSKPHDAAFLQFTSGSTSQPKGVVITHRNIMANLAMIKDAFGQTPEDSTVSWLPLHHDMGLIGCVLEPLYLGARAMLMSPIAFLQKPARWLNAMARFEATTAGAPNFAYELCARSITEAQISGIDLSRWRLAFCGSEPIRAETMSKFVRRFGAIGFRGDALYPCYGLAEATLFVTGGRPGNGTREQTLRYSDKHRMPAVSCGTPNRGTSVLLLETGAAQSVAPGSVGEIAVSGDQVSPGFWDSDRGIVPDQQRLVSIDGRSYLRTGDLGALQDGELYVVGRLKNMIIVRGANIYAEDIELTVKSLPECVEIAAVVALPAAADAMQTEGVSIVCEVARGASPSNADALLMRIAGAVADVHGVLPAEVVLVPSGAIERTLSGKLQRARTAELLADGKLDALARFEPRRPAPLRAIA